MDEKTRRQLDRDASMYGFAVYNASTGKRVDPREITPIMDEFNPSDFFKAIRRSASVRAGAVIFGQAQIAYYDTLKESMSEEEAYNMLAHTTEAVVRGVFSAVGPMAEVLLKAAAMLEWMEAIKPPASGKEVPGEGEKKVPGE